MSETKEISLKDCFTKPLSKGYNAVIIGEGEKEYFTKWKMGDAAAMSELHDIIGQEGIRLLVTFEVKNGYKNWTEFEILGERKPDFEKASESQAGGEKEPGKPASTRPSDRPKEPATDPEKEEKIYEAHKLHDRANLVVDMAYYLSVAKDAWIEALYPFEDKTTRLLDKDDKEAIQKIAVHLRMDKVKGR